MRYPRLLLIALGRVNAADTSNNGLLLRNLLSDWPREHLAQIYSSGDNKDEGVAGRYFKIGPSERAGGDLFSRGKEEVVTHTQERRHKPQNSPRSETLRHRVALAGKQTIADTGLYELVFPLKASPRLLDWVEEFRPDVILAQGYSLGMVTLPLAIRRHFNTRLATFWSDDWPTYLYAGQLGELGFARWLMRPLVDRQVKRLVAAADVAFAFGEPMAEAYHQRYKRAFYTLGHSDDAERFRSAEPLRYHPKETISLVVAGNVNRYRAPLLLDLAECCGRLSERGRTARVCAVVSGMESGVKEQLAGRQFLDIMKDPGSATLPSYLKGADILVLAESFDESYVQAIRLSISSKAHLFMFSERPIIVYAHRDTGVAHYARSHGWAQMVTTRDPELLCEAVESLVDNLTTRSTLVERARHIAQTSHDSAVMRSRFGQAVSELVAGGLDV